MTSDEEEEEDEEEIDEEDLEGEEVLERVGPYVLLDDFTELVRSQHRVVGLLRREPLEEAGVLGDGVLAIRVLRLPRQLFSLLPLYLRARVHLLTVLTHRERLGQDLVREPLVLAEVKVNAEPCRLLFNVLNAELGEVIQEYLFINFAQKARKLRVVEEDPGPELGNLSRLNLALLEVGVPQLVEFLFYF